MTISRKICPALSLSFILIAITQTSYAQSKACLDEKAKASTMKNDCVEINKSKGTEEFNKCLEGLKVQVAKANKVCEAGNQEPSSPKTSSPKPPTAPAKTPAASDPKPQAAPTKTPVASEQTPQAAPAKTPAASEQTPQAAPTKIPAASEQTPQAAPAKNSAQASQKPIAITNIGESEKGIPNRCINELVELPNTKQNFNMASFPKDLAATVVKVQAGVKFQTVPLLGSMLGPGPDDNLTEAGITVGCAKKMPTDPAGIKSLLMKVGLEMGKSAVASKLGVSRDEVPSNFSELKGFAIKTATLKTSEALGIEASEVPTDLKGMESLISDNIKKQAAKKLGVDKNSIPSDKSELSGFIKKAAKAKIAEEIGIKPSEVNLSKASLAEYAKEEESLAPVANLVNAANILEVLGLVNSLSAFTGGGGDSGGSSAFASSALADDDDEDEEDEKPAKKSFKKQSDDDDDDEKPSKKKSNSKSKNRETRYGIKGAYYISSLSEYFGMPTQQSNANYNSRPGYGFEFGAISEFPISDIWSLVVGVNYISRELTLEYPIYNEVGVYYDYYYTDVIKEGVANFPVMLKVMPFGGPLYYAQLGLQVDVPLLKEGGDRWGWRETDVSITWSVLGWHIGDNFAIELKNAYGLSTYFKVEPTYGLKLLSSDIALIYMF